jgi:LysM repeat protein
MNDKLTNDTNSESENIARTLTETAGKITLTPNFAAELEQKLRSAHRPRRLWFASSFKQVSPTLGWIALIVLFGLALNWSIRTLIPAPQPAAGTTPTGFICPVTEPNGSPPPFENYSPSHHGNGEIWTGLWPNGKVYMLPDNHQADGSFSMKWWFWRNSTEPLSIEGHRLDIESDPLRVFYTGGYDDSGIFIVALIFPATGCWEVTARVGESSLTFVTEVVFGVATPTPNPEMIQPRETPTPDNGSYDWRGTRLYFTASLPDSQTEAEVYLWKADKPATLDDARALAQQFGMNGEPGETPGEFPGNFDYLLIDGNRRLHLRSDHYFTYHSNFENMTLGKPSEERARAVIDDFLKNHGFDFEYHLESAPQMQGQHFYVMPLTPDGREMRFDYMMPVRYEVTLDDTEGNIIISGYSLDYESLGKFGIISAGEAFQKILDPNLQTGLMESFRGQGGGGGGSSFLKLNLSGAPVPFPTSTPQYIVTSGSTYIVQENDTLSSIAEYFGITLEQLTQANNLSDANIINTGQVLLIPEIPSSQRTVSQKIDGVRGLLNVTIYNESDSSKRAEYTLMYIPKGQNGVYALTLEGDNLQLLQSYQNRPIEIWGTVDHYDQQTGLPVVKIERYQIPFPTLQFQILRGKQKIISIAGQSLTLFTTEDGMEYIQTMPTGSPSSPIVENAEGDVLVEALIVPDEVIEGYPVIRVFSSGMAINPQNGETVELTVTADQIYTINETPQSLKTYVPPTATIERVDLVYHVRYPPYAMVDPAAGMQYLQPAWRFYGRYSDGSEFEILVQALKQDFLLPELAPYTPPG